MNRRTGPFTAAVTLTRPEPAPYIDKNGIEQEAAANQPRFNYDAGQAEGLLLDSLLTERAALVPDPAFNELEGTWVFTGALENARPLPGSGFDELLTGEGALVLVYQGGVGQCWADGQLLYTVDPITPAMATAITAGGDARAAFHQYRPYAISDTEAAQLATGAFEIVTPPALLADLSAQEYGTRDEAGAFQRRPYSGVLDLTRPGPTTAWDAQGNLVTVPSGEPAFDHDPVTGEPLGQQIVAFPYANILRASETMSDWFEVPEDVTLEEISWGDFKEWKIQSNTAPASGYYLKSYFNRNLSSGGVWADTTFNVRLRQGSCRYAVFTVQSSSYNPSPGGQSDTGSRYINVCVDFEEKTVTKFTSGNNAGDFTLKDSWSGDVVLLQCRLDSYFGTGANGYYYSISPSTAPADNVNLSDPQGGTVFASMCSVNDHGTFDLPYVPTYTDTAATRPADIDYSAEPFADRYNPERGSLFFHYNLATGFFALSVQGSYPSTNANTLQITESALRLTNVLTYAADMTGEHKVLVSWGDGQIVFYVDGARVQSTSAGMPNLIVANFFRRADSAGEAQGHDKQFWLDDQPVTEARGVELTTL